MAQIDYNLYHGKGYVGGIADLSPREVETKFNEESQPGFMGFGRGVTYGTSDDSILFPVSAGAGIIGFTILTHNHELSGVGSDEISIAENDVVDVLRDGSIYVQPETAVSQGEQVFVRHTVATTELLGAVRNDLDTDKAVAVDWEFGESGDADTIVKIRKR